MKTIQIKIGNIVKVFNKPDEAIVYIAMNSGSQYVNLFDNDHYVICKNSKELFTKAGI